MKPRDSGVILEPLDTLLEDLWIFFMRMRNQRERETWVDDNMAERFVFFRDRSSAGLDCKYAQGCKKIFFQRDKEELKNLFLKCLESWRYVEGEDFGR